MTPDEWDKEILHQMLLLKDRMEQTFRHLGDIADDPKVDGRVQLKALKERYVLAIELFKLNMEIAYTAKKLGYGVAKTRSKEFLADYDAVNAE